MHMVFLISWIIDAHCFADIIDHQCTQCCLYHGSLMHTVLMISLDINVHNVANIMDLRCMWCF